MSLTVEEAKTHSEAVDQWWLFKEFCRWEKASGGPDPQLPLFLRMAETAGIERDWAVGCYGAVYNVPGAQILWERFDPWEIRENPDEVQGSLEAIWAGLPFRRERRAVRTPVKLARYLVSYARWLDTPRPWVSPSDSGPYKDSWASLQGNVWGAGRYIISKMLGAFEKAGEPTVQPDFLAQGGWSPRECLAMLWPEHADTLLNDDTRAGARITDEIALNTQARLWNEFGLEISMYDLQTCACEYRENILSRRQYPGRSLDSELKHWSHAYSHGMIGDQMMAARKALFPQQHLGEENGWMSTRDELGHIAADHHYQWSDLLYDFQSTSDFSEPVKWKHSL